MQYKNERKEELEQVQKLHDELDKEKVDKAEKKKK